MCVCVFVCLGVCVCVCVCVCVFVCACVSMLVSHVCVHVSRYLCQVTRPEKIHSMPCTQGLQGSENTWPHEVGCLAGLRVAMQSVHV